jgi:2,4-dienoyl-CoA reductase-like NADH-dependent reductase (Old Yellow Enzyme family)
MIEATAVTANGRITPEDSGIWSDDHIAPLAGVVTFAHSQSQKIGIQLAHAGRKASTVAPWISGDPLASEAVGGWPDDVWGPSDVPYSDAYPKVKALSKEGIKSVVQAFGDAAGRALKAGFDVVEIHGAHGYLLSSFLSPVANKRTDEYGGSFENRTRLILEVVDKVRSVIPEQMPLFFRISGTDWLEDTSEPSWRAADTARLAPLLYAHGIDLIDISSGGNSANQKIGTAPIVPAGVRAYQSPLAKTVMDAIGAQNAYPPPPPPPAHSGAHKSAAASSAAASDANNMLAEGPARPERLIVSTVGAITSGEQAEKLLQDGCADVVMVGRHFQKNPGTVWEFAEELGVNIQLASQIRWGFKGRGKKTSDGKEDHGKDADKSNKAKS